MGLLGNIFNPLSSRSAIHKVKPRQVNTCPYCGIELNPVPQRKKKCPRCGQFIYVRTQPSDRKRMLVTYPEALSIEREWTRKSTSGRDAKWKSLNEQLIVAMKKGNWGLMSSLYFEQGIFLEEEKRDSFKVMQESRKCALRNYQLSGIDRVKILTCGSDSCPECQTLEGKMFTVAEAMKIMPIPVKSCINKYGHCRCLYTPVVEI